MTSSLVLLGAAIALGEVLVLRIGPTCPVPLAYAWYPVVAARFGAPAFAVTVAAGTVVGLVASRSAWGDAGRKLLAQALEHERGFGGHGLENLLALAADGELVALGAFDRGPAQGRIGLRPP